MTYYIRHEVSDVGDGAGAALRTEVGGAPCGDDVVPGRWRWPGPAVGQHDRTGRGEALVEFVQQGGSVGPVEAGAHGDQIESRQVEGIEVVGVALAPAHVVDLGGGGERGSFVEHVGIGSTAYRWATSGARRSAIWPVPHPRSSTDWVPSRQMRSLTVVNSAVG